MELPDYLVSGEVARLIPVIADSRKEQRAASAFLAVASAVPQFAQAIFSQFGPKIGPRSQTNTFTEVSFATGIEPGSDRPDGLIEIRSGGRRWTALLEVKIAGAELKREQIERYLQLARVNKIDALITISNQFATLPTHHPVSVSKHLVRSISLFHISWTAVLTEAMLLHENAAISDPDQAFILREFIRFLSHNSVGVMGYTTMPPEWKKLVELVQSDGSLKKSTPGLPEVVSGWHEEIRDLSLLMSRELGRSVDVQMSRSHKSDPVQRLRDDVADLSSTMSLNADLRIPDAASDLSVCADLRRKIIRVGMHLDAPGDKKRATARLNWLLRQIRDTDPQGVFINTIWPTRRGDTVFPMTTLRDDPNLLSATHPSSVPRAFEVALHCDAGQRFASRKKFIEDLERTTSIFYEQIGQHLQAWRPRPPKPKHAAIVEKSGESEKTPHAATAAGNDHTDLLEIPRFLYRPKADPTAGQKDGTEGEGARVLRGNLGFLGHQTKGR